MDRVWGGVPGSGVLHAPSSGTNATGRRHVLERANRVFPGVEDVEDRCMRTVEGGGADEGPRTCAMGTSSKP
jgi:hypothetical protein